MPDKNPNVYLSVVIPAYNEEKRLPPSLDAISAYLRTKDFAWEIVVVDDGSSDRTVELAEALLKDTPHRVLRNPYNMGKALTVKNGLEQSFGKIALFTDSDLSTPIEEVDKLLAALEHGADVAIGSRQMPGSIIETHQPWYRELAGKAFGLLNRTILDHGIYDTQCGFKAFTRDAIAAILPLQKVTDWAFDAELMLIAHRLGLKVAQLPVRWIDSPDTKVKMIVDGPKMVLDLFRIRWIHRRLQTGRPITSRRK